MRQTTMWLAVGIALIGLQGGALAAGKRHKPAAKAEPVAAAAEEPADPATYKPKTQYDNTPYRFNMNQNGKRMTAEEFDAWMKARGIRVAKGKPAGAAPAQVAQSEAAGK